MEEIFFQSSLPRAGSTLLQNILGQNPDFYVTPTSGVLELLFAARQNYTNDKAFISQDPDLMKKGWLNFCRQGLEGFYKGITHKKFIVDKSRGWGIHYNFLNSFYSNPKIVCIVRDLRSIYASMEKNFRKNSDKDSGIVNWAEMKGTTTAKRVDIWAQTPPIGIALERLKQIIDENIDKNILFIRFEDLTSNPQIELDKVYDFFGTDRYQHNFKNVKQITQEDDTVHGIFGDHTIRKEVKPVLEQHNEYLGLELSQSIVNTYPWFYEYFNYNI
jgi:sulfotransferase